MPLGRDFRVVAADLRGHGDGIRLRSRFRLEDCADDIAALAAVLDIRGFAAVGYSMGGLVAQLLCRRHAGLVLGLVLCSTAGNARGSPAEQLAASAMPTVAAALRWNPLLHLMGAEFVGMALLGRIDDPATSRWARAQLNRTTLATVVSATEAVSSSPRTAGSARSMCPPRWSLRTGTVSCRQAARPRWPGRSRARRSTTWTPVTGPASTRRSCSPARCWRPAGRHRLAAAAHCAYQPDPAGPRDGRHPEPPPAATHDPGRSLLMTFRSASGNCRMSWTAQNRAASAVTAIRASSAG